MERYLTLLRPAFRGIEGGCLLPPLGLRATRRGRTIRGWGKMKSRMILPIPRTSLASSAT